MLPHIKYFYHVANSGSFSRAAEELFISQPALSRQIASLEKILEMQLFYRQGRKLQLTDAGRRLFNYAEKIMKLNYEAQKEMLELKDLTSGALTIGASTTVGNYLLTSVLASYRNHHPGIKLTVNISNSGEIERAVLNNQVDLGLIGSGVEKPGIFQEKFAEDELFLVVSPTHRLAKTSEAILPSQLAQETLLLREEGSDTRRMFIELLKKMNVEPASFVNMGHTEAIKNGIINNLGISFLSKHTWQSEWKLGYLVPLEKYKMRRPLKLIYLKNARLSPAALMFTASIKKYYTAYPLYQRL